MTLRAGSCIEHDRSSMVERLQRQPIIAWDDGIGGTADDALEIFNRELRFAIRAADDDVHFIFAVTPSQDRDEPASGSHRRELLIHDHGNRAARLERIQYTRIRSRNIQQRVPIVTRGKVDERLDTEWIDRGGG